MERGGGAIAPAATGHSVEVRAMPMTIGQVPPIQRDLPSAPRAASGRDAPAAIHADFSCSADEDQAALRFAAETPEAALCTIVGIDGSFSRRLGGQLAIAPGGRMTGSLSDGCLEKELAAQCVSMKLLGNGPRVLRFGKGSPFIDFRLPCGSGLDILLDPAPDRGALLRTVARLDARSAAALPLPVPAAAGPLMRERVYTPSLRIAICGAGPEAAWLEKLAAMLEIACVQLGPERGLHLNSIPSWIAADEWTAITLLFHDHEWERAILRWALSTPAFYIGAMGGKQARANRHDMLAEIGACAEDIARVRSPIGLIKHARDARLLALSVLSEISEGYEARRVIRC